MKCPKCNNNLNDNSQYCRFCGHKLENDHDNQYLYSELYSNAFRPTVTSDEDYIKTYIGNNYENVKKEQFSLIAFILGPFYLLSKKVYTPAILLLLITIGLYSYNPDIAYIFYVVISAYIGLKGNSMYLQHATRKVEEIKISNPDKSSTEILEICKTLGKPRINYLLIIALLLVIAGTSYCINIFNHNIKINNNKDINNNEEIEETIYKTKKMTYPVSSKFKNTATTNNYASYQYKDDKNYCHIILIVDKFYPVYQSIDEYVEKNVYINSPTETIRTIPKEDNKTQFAIKEIKSNTTNRSLFFKVIDNDIYYIEYTENKNYDNNYCQNTIYNFIWNASFDE